MRTLALLCLSLCCAGAARAQASFTKGLSPADFQAAGLGKLSPEELARLDELVSGRQAGAVTQAKEETRRTVTAQVKAEDQAAARKQASGGFIDRMKVVLRPGTDIEYTELDAEIAPPFNGWQKGTVFSLSNGQRWVAVDNDDYWGPRIDKPVHVRIVPGALGSFFIVVEGCGRARVKFLGSTAPAQAAAQ